MWIEPAPMRPARKSGLRSDFRFSSRPMPESQHVNDGLIRQDFVNDAKWTVNDFANGGIADFRNQTAALGKSGERKSLIDQFISKRVCALRVVLCDENDGLSQVFYRLRRENYFEAHESTSLRASSAGMPSLRRACSRAVLIPASNSTSRAISASDMSSGNRRTNSMTVSLLLIPALSASIKNTQIGKLTTMCRAASVKRDELLTRISRKLL
jgi:hypothetical protein